MFSTARIFGLSAILSVAIVTAYELPQAREMSPVGHKHIDRVLPSAAHTMGQIGDFTPLGGCSDGTDRRRQEGRLAPHQGPMIIARPRLGRPSRVTASWPRTVRRPERQSVRSPSRSAPRQIPRPWFAARPRRWRDVELPRRSGPRPARRHATNPKCRRYREGPSCKSAASGLRKSKMPVLDAKVLETDPEGVALLRSVLQTGRCRKWPASRPLRVDLPNALPDKWTGPPQTPPPSPMRVAESCA
jgi:hypothetical protein